MNVLVFGATGSAGRSVLDAALAAPDVNEVRTIARRRVALDHPKLHQHIHDDFLDYMAVANAFRDVQACMFCLGVSSLQVKEEAAYRRITKDFAVAAARALRQESPGAAFHFISGMGTDRNGRQMWARVKAEAEDELIRGVGAVCYRPAFIDGAVPDRGAWYHGPWRHAFRLLRPFESLYVSGADLGNAMLRATREGLRARVVENREIREIAARAAAAQGSTPESRR